MPRTPNDVKKLAKEAGADERGLDDLYQLSGWKAEKDEPDEEGIKKLLEDIKAKKPLYFPAPTDAEPTKEEPPVRRVPAADRGGPHNPSKTGIYLTPKHLADPAFMLDPRNKEMIASAAREGRFRLPDRQAQ